MLISVYLSVSSSLPPLSLSRQLSRGVVCACVWGGAHAGIVLSLHTARRERD
jgi:hypothetical protein